MKKILALLLALCMVFALAACGQQAAPAEKPAEQPAEQPTEKPAEQPAEPPAEQPAEQPAEENPAMSYEEFAAAAIEDPVTIKAAVQATQSWWNDQITVYTQDQDGAYFLYNMACSEEDAAKLVPGQWILVNGFKAEWAGEVEIIDATFELLDDEPYVAQPVDATEVWGTVDMINYMNQLVVFRGVTVEAYDDSGAAFAYKDPEGKTDDLYFKVTKGDTTYEFCVEFYLCGKDTDVYKSVEALQVGDVIDLQGFLYWYNGPNLQATGVKPADPADAAPVDELSFMSYAEYAAAELDEPVTVLAWVQATQSWWDNKISVYAADHDGAYFIYDMACSEEDAAKLVPGTKILVNGYKSEWSGEVEIVDGSFEFVDGDSFLAEPLDLEALIGKEDLADYINRFFKVTGTVVEKGDGLAFFFDWNNAGEEGRNDLYFDVEVGGEVITFVARRYLTLPSSEPYQGVMNLKVGDTVEIEGFLYWYEGPQPHITSLTVK